MKHIKPFNESVRKHLLPKSDEDIRKSLENLSPAEKLNKIRTYDLYNFITDDELKELRKLCKDGINKVVKDHVKKYGDNFAKEFIKKFPNVESHIQKLYEYIPDYYDDDEMTMDEILEADPEIEYNMIQGEFDINMDNGEESQMYYDLYDDLYLAGW